MSGYDLSPEQQKKSAQVVQAKRAASAPRTLQTSIGNRATRELVEPQVRYGEAEPAIKSFNDGDKGAAWDTAQKADKNDEERAKALRDAWPGLHRIPNPPRAPHFTDKGYAPKVSVMFQGGAPAPKVTELTYDKNTDDETRKYWGASGVVYLDPSAHPFDEVLPKGTTEAVLTVFDNKNMHNIIDKAHFPGEKKPKDEARAKAHQDGPRVAVYSRRTRDQREWDLQLVDWPKGVTELANDLEEVLMVGGMFRAIQSNGFIVDFTLEEGEKGHLKAVLQNLQQTSFEDAPYVHSSRLPASRVSPIETYAAYDHNIEFAATDPQETFITWGDRGEGESPAKLWFAPFELRGSALVRGPAQGNVSIKLPSLSKPLADAIRALPVTNIPPKYTAMFQEPYRSYLLAGLDPMTYRVVAPRVEKNHRNVAAGDIDANGRLFVVSAYDADEVEGPKDLTGGPISECYYVGDFKRNANGMITFVPRAPERALRAEGIKIEALKLDRKQGGFHGVATTDDEDYGSRIFTF